MGGFFDPASFKEVLVTAPVNSAGCTYADYNGAWDVSDKVVLVAGDTALCDFGVKVMLAQTQGAVGVILYGDGIPAGSQISWEVDDPALGFEIRIPVIITSQAQGKVLQRALLSGPTWVDLYCGHTQHLAARPWTADGK